MLATLVLNISMDDMDFQPLTGHYDTVSFNEMNSAIEYILEGIFNFRDVFPETNRNNQHDQSKSPVLKHIGYKMMVPKPYVFKSVTKPMAFNKPIKFRLPKEDAYSYLFSKEINQPPCFQTN